MREMPSPTSATHMSLALPSTPQQFVHPGITLAQLASILWAYRKLSAVIMASVILLVGAACALWPRSYAATATLMVNFEVNDPLAGRDFPTGLLGSYMATQVELARGSEVLLPVIDRLHLTTNPDYASGYPGNVAGLRNWVEERMRKHLVIEQGLYGSQLIYITYTTGSPVEAASIANTVADVYSEQQYTRLNGPASERAKRYTEQLTELKAKVNRAQVEVTGFRQRSGIVDADAKIDVDMQTLATLEQRQLEAANSRRMAEARAATDQAVGAQVLASPMIQALKTQLALQRAHLAEVRSALGPSYPERIELESQANATREELNSELRAYSGNARAELASARELEQKLQYALDTERAKMVRVHQMQDEGAKYQLELESAQSVYKRALDGYDQIMFASTGGYTNVSFVSRATPPPKATSPKLRVALILAVLAGGALGFGIPLAYELLNRRVRCRDDVERDHGISVLVELGGIGGPRRLLAGGAS